MLDVMRYWYRPSLHFFTALLLPFSWLFGLIAGIRRMLYRFGLLKIRHFQKPVIVVGNITVGGTGKTPFVIWLANYLRSQGYKPGIVSRGVGGKQFNKPHWVKLNDNTDEVGDEAILLLEATHSPVVICKQRVLAVDTILQKTDCDVIISDDGLQHYKLGRNIEIILIDGERFFGNGCLLPAGPLREPLSRLQSADFLVINGEKSDKLPDATSMSLIPNALVSLVEDKQPSDLISFPYKKIHAVAGIGNPSRFFQSLKKSGFDVIPHVFPDHHLYQPGELDFKDALPIIMTKKDAVKCKKFADERYWYLDITAKIEETLQQALLLKLKGAGHESYEEDFSRHACHSGSKQYFRGGKRKR